MNHFKKSVLALQHLLGAFGSTILVGLLVGIPVENCLLGAGIGTLIFHLVTKGDVPIFLGSSFAFIGVTSAIGNKYGLEYAFGGIVVAGLCYVLFSIITYFIGSDRILKLFPPVIRGSIIVTIGLTLAPSVINSSIIDSAVGTLSQRWIIALSVVIAMTIVSVFLKGFLKSIPILFGLLVGYLVAFSFGLVDLSTLQELSFIQVPTLTLPKFNMESILLIAPVSLITLVEHIGDITTNGAITNRDYIKEVGLHRTLLGDGLASMFAGFIGAPANTSYSENSALLAMTKIYDPSILRLTAIYAIILSFFGKFTGFIATMPSPIVGGISILLFGMISTVGIRQLQKVDFGTNKNTIVVSLMLVLGLSGVTILIGEVTISGMPLAAMIGVVANQLLPDRN